MELASLKRYYPLILVLLFLPEVEGAHCKEPINFHSNQRTSNLQQESRNGKGSVREHSFLGININKEAIILQSNFIDHHFALWAA